MYEHRHRWRSAQNGGMCNFSVPRLGITVEASLMEQVICNSVQELEYDRPRPDQLEAVLQFVASFCIRSMSLRQVP